MKVKLSVKLKLFVLLLCVCAILPGKAVPEMTYTVSGDWRDVKPYLLTHSSPTVIQHFQSHSISSWWNLL